MFYNKSTIILKLAFCLFLFSCVEQDNKKEPPRPYVEEVYASGHSTSDKGKAIIDQLSKRDSIVNFALELKGIPYKTASCSRDGFDCSGLVYFVFKELNVNVPRSSSGYGNFGKEVSIKEVQKGDVLVFKSPTRNAIGHVGIVTTANGANSEFIHATSGKAMQVVVTNLSNRGYTDRFIKAVDVL